MSGVPTAVFRPIVERWLASFENAEKGFVALASESGVDTDSWRRRLSDDTYENRAKTARLARGWFALPTVSEEKVDEFLTAAGLTFVWQGELEEYVAPLELTEEELDATCGECGSSIDWSRGDAGVRIELSRRGRGKRRQRWSLCSLCALELPHPGPGTAVAGQTTRIPDAAAKELYRRYVLEQMPVRMLAEAMRERYGYKSVNSAEQGLLRIWRRMNLPMRSRAESKRAALKRHRKRYGKFTVRQLRAAHAYYLRNPTVSLNALGAKLAPQFGYKTGQSCAVTLSEGFRALGLPIRGRIEQVVLTTTTSGLSPRDHRERARRRREAGLTYHRATPYRQFCVGTTKGRRCEARSMEGSVYCFQHDPDAADARGEHLAEVHAQTRARFAGDDYVDWEPVRQELHEAFVREGRSWKRIAAATGIKQNTLSTMCSRPGWQQRVKREKAERLLEAVRDDLLAVG